MVTLTNVIGTNIHNASISWLTAYIINRKYHSLKKYVTMLTAMPGAVLCTEDATSALVVLPF